MKLTENYIRDIIRESIYNLLNEVHLKEVDNIKEIAQMVGDSWTSPDDVWWVKIEARLKDYKHFNARNPRARGMYWKQTPGPDGTKRENHVGYVIVRGATKEACVQSLMNAVVHLNPWAAQKLHTDIVYSNGNADAIRQVCKFFFARAYITINHRSMQQTIDRAREDKKVGLFKGREFHHRVGQSRTGIDASGVNWSVNRPLGLIDCDIDDPVAQQKLDAYLKNKGITPLFRKPSHDGMHYVIKIADAQGLDFSFMDNYASNNRKNDPKVLFKPDANLLLYSAVG